MEYYWQRLSTNCLYFTSYFRCLTDVTHTTRLFRTCFRQSVAIAPEFVAHFLDIWFPYAIAYILLHETASIQRWSVRSGFQLGQLFTFFYFLF